jgi:hypothetical protein
MKPIPKPNQPPASITSKTAYPTDPSVPPVSSGDLQSRILNPLRQPLSRSDQHLLKLSGQPHISQIKPVTVTPKKLTLQLMAFCLGAIYAGNVGFVFYQVTLYFHSMSRKND